MTAVIRTEVSALQPIPRPWWWWANPWLYALRLEVARECSLDIIVEDGQHMAKLSAEASEWRRFKAVLSRLLLAESEEVERAVVESQGWPARRGGSPAKARDGVVLDEWEEGREAGALAFRIVEDGGEGVFLEVRARGEDGTWSEWQEEDLDGPGFDVLERYGLALLEGIGAWGAPMPDGDLFRCINCKWRGPLRDLSESGDCPSCREPAEPL
jgi:hypothetical protein